MSPRSYIVDRAIHKQFRDQLAQLLGLGSIIPQSFFAFLYMDVLVPWHHCGEIAAIIDRLIPDMEANTIDHGENIRDALADCHANKQDLNIKFTDENTG